MNCDKNAFSVNKYYDDWDHDEGDDESASIVEHSAVFSHLLPLAFFETHVIACTKGLSNQGF